MKLLFLGVWPSVASLSVFVAAEVSFSVAMVAEESGSVSTMVGEVELLWVAKVSSHSSRTVFQSFFVISSRLFSGHSVSSSGSARLKDISSNAPSSSSASEFVICRLFKLGASDQGDPAELNVSCIM